jgi:short-subunit dehydrogenase
LNRARPTALILGATSDIGRAIALRLAVDGYGLVLAARDAGSLERDATDIEVRTGAPVARHVFDILDAAAHERLLAAMPELPDVAVCVVGLLGDQAESERDLNAAERVFATNFTGPARLLGAIANRFADRGSGTIVGVSSVAGDRGRASNYVYGSAKGGFTAFLSGLRARLVRKGVHVVTVKPGFVRTRMTEGMKLPGPLVATPDEVADCVAKAIARKRDVVYAKARWRWIMLVIRLVPERLFKRIRF